MSYPLIIQGGMGVGVSSWLLAKTVARCGQLGVISGTALDLTLSRRLQAGDPGGHLRRALAHFPVPEMVQRVLDRYFVPGGKEPEAPFKAIPMWNLHPRQSLVELAVIANFVEVFLAKEGHKGIVGVNYLEKIQMPNLASIYGAMLAGVDYVLMGAGIPREIPGILDRFAGGEAADLKLNVTAALPTDDFRMRFDPRQFFPGSLPLLLRPNFLAIIASVTLALSLARKSSGKVDGFVIEGPTAGGHNAPPRGAVQFNVSGEPIYGEKDEVDLEQIRGLGLPFWLAGSYGHPDQLQEAVEAGAEGIQVGTAFALCRESGLSEEIKEQLRQKGLRDEGRVFTDPIASPTGFPFKVAELEGTLSHKEEYEARPRICDLGYLRQANKGEEGSLTYRCPAEPIEAYLGKGGKLEDTVGRKCLCNGLLANMGFSQQQKRGYIEKPLVTIGDDYAKLAQALSRGRDSYSAEDVIQYLLGAAEETPQAETRDVADSRSDRTDSFDLAKKRSRTLVPV